MAVAHLTEGFMYIIAWSGCWPDPKEKIVSLRDKSGISYVRDTSRH